MSDERPFREGETVLAYINRVVGELAPGFAVVEAGCVLRTVDCSTWSERRLVPENVGGAWAEVEMARPLPWMRP